MSTPDYSQRKAAMKVYLSCIYYTCMTMTLLWTAIAVWLRFKCLINWWQNEMYCIYQQNTYK